MLANLLAFVPLGLLVRLIWADENAERIRWPFAFALIGAVCYAALLQWLQIFLPMRQAALMDVAMNLIGIALGLLLAPLAHARRWPLRLRAFWSLYLLSPFLPASPARALWQWRQLWQEPFSWAAFFPHTLAWLYLGQQAGRYRPRLPLWALGLLGLMFFIRHGGLGPAVLLGAGFGLLLAHTPLAGFRQLTLLALLGWVGYRGLTPWTALPFASEFHWLPFRFVALGDPRLVLSVLAEKCFWYSCLIHAGSLLAGANAPRARWTWVAFLLLFLAVIEAQQRYRPGHLAETTDLLLVLLLTLGWRRLERIT
jgi:VanZ family protein